MKFFINPENKETFAYDDKQQDLIDKAIKDSWSDVTDLWPPKPDFKDVQAAALAKIDAFHAQTLQTLVGNPTQAEKDTWSLKVTVANAINNNQQTCVPGETFLTAAGIATDDDKKAWAKSVLTKSQKYAEAVGLAEKLRNQAKAAVNSATNEEELNAALDEQKTIANEIIAGL
jgi:hypothetical protein